MCKLFVIPSIVGETEEKAMAFAKAMGKEMSGGNSDGLGYAAFSGEGDLFGERWLKNSEAFAERSELTQLDRFLMNECKGFLEKEDKYNKFGSVKESNIRSIILHTRFATSGKQFINTHPHVYGDTALIHNGIVDVKKGDLKRSTCDSEKILNLYMKMNVANKPSNIKKVVSALDGYFACAVLSKLKDGTPILDIFKDDKASLYGAYISELSTVVFATSYSDIFTVAKAQGLTIASPYNIKNNMMIRFNALTGKPMLTQRFKTKARKHTVTHYGGGSGSGNYGGYGEHGSARGEYNDYGYGEYASRGKHSRNYDILVPEQDYLEKSIANQVVEPTAETESDKENKTGQTILRMASGFNVNDGWRFNDNTQEWRKETK